MMRQGSKWTRVVLLACAAAPAALTGCQSQVGGQTLPSAYYLRDDVQYFPHGPEFKLTEQERVLNEYKLERDLLRQQTEEGIPASAPPPILP